MLGNHVYFCNEKGLSWTKDMDLFLWLVHVRLMIMPSEKEAISGWSPTGIPKCPLRCHRDGSDKKARKYTLMGVEEQFDEICLTIHFTAL